MTYQDRQSAAPPKRESVVHPRRRGSLTAAHRGDHVSDSRYMAAYRRLLARHRLLIRRVGIGAGVLAGVLTVVCLGLFWRLSSGPIQLDVATPWLVAAIEENFGSEQRVEVGGTQIERTENGGAAVRIRDIVVRDPDGTVVASAPKAEVRVSGMSLLSGHMRAESLNLVGAGISVRIERDGDVTVFAGTDKKPIATASVPPGGGVAPPSTRGVQAAARSALTAPIGAPPATLPSTEAAPAAAPPPRPADALAALLAWIDGIGESGLDGHELRELGLKNGNLTVDDARTGKQWTFKDITLSLERPHGGGMVVTLGSDNRAKPWGITASIKPTRNGTRLVELEARKVSASDLFLALRLGDGNLHTNLPLSASMRGEFGADGIPVSLTGRIVADAGFFTDGEDTDGRIDLDRAEFKFEWDAANHVLSVPFQILSGANRVTLMGQVDAPREIGGPWSFKIGGGTVVLGSSVGPGDALILNRVAVSGRFDPAKKRFIVDGGDIGNADLGLAMSGNADYSTGEVRLAAGLAATRMPVTAMKRLWPVFVSPKVRNWFNDHLMSGTVERAVIAVNAPLNTLKASGPPVPDDGLSIDAVATGCVIKPVEGLPALHDADLNVHLVGRNAQIAVNKAISDFSSGRKLVLSSGLFEVPDTDPHDPPARVHFKIDGPVPAALELLSTDRLRDSAGVPFDASTTRGTISALVSLAMPLKPDLPPGSTNYAISVDATNFSADHLIMGQKVDAAALHVNANPQGFQLKGDVKIAGAPAALEYKKARGDSDAEVHISGMFDETARTNLGLDPSNTISGSIPIKLAGRVSSSSDRDGRYAIEADLTPAQINGFLPGWVKGAGKPARATFTVTTKPQSTRIDDLVIEGTGGGVKGTVELDGSGELLTANFPSFGFSDGDKASLKVERAPDGALRVVMRGDVYDGRGFIKTVTGGPQPSGQPAKRPPDIDVDMKLGAVVGYDGEAIRSLDLKMSRRAGEIRSLGLSAKIGRDAPLTGDLRARPGYRQAVVVETADAGALLRFTDIYSRMNGGQLTLTMDAPSGDNPTQQGTLVVRSFSVHDESQLQSAVAQNNGGDIQRTNTIDFSSMRVEFTKTPGRVALRDGVVRGPLLGATIDGMLDYMRDEVHLRGTLVPLYGANNLLGQLPVVGLFLGGEKEGLVGITYEVVGRPGSPVLHVNPISALAPGLLRKVFEYPAGNAPYGGQQQ
jgi:Protein of unknown function